MPYYTLSPFVSQSISIWHAKAGTPERYACLYPETIQKFQWFKLSASCFRCCFVSPDSLIFPDIFSIQNSSACSLLKTEATCFGICTTILIYCFFPAITTHFLPAEFIVYYAPAGNLFFMGCLNSWYDIFDFFDKIFNPDINFIFHPAIIIKHT